MNSELKALILHVRSGNVCIPTLNFPAQSWWLTSFMGCSVSASALLELSLACQGARVAGREMKACRSVPLTGDRSWGRGWSGTSLQADSQLRSCASLCLLCLCVCLTWTLVFALQCRASWAPALQYSVLRALGRQDFLEKSWFQTGLHIPTPASAMNYSPAHCTMLEISKHRKKRDEIHVPPSRQACDECVLVPSPALRCWSVITSYFGPMMEPVA